MASGKNQNVLLFRLVVLGCGLGPAIILLVKWLFGDMGANPPEYVVHFTGLTGLTLLLATIAFSPAFRLSRWVGFMIARRQMGLWAFFWLVMHMLSWMGLDQYWDWPWIYQEMLELEYVRYGAGALLLLIPLALTSFSRAPAVLGWSAWHWLHRLVYVSAALGVTHFWILTRADYLLPGTFALVFAGLASFRILDGMIHRQ
ncbi:ferric reductase-like transmembrane domain-containing protein [Halomonas sp. Bachu 37]|uniref:sulfite oxidase heme-binding subunit YedZ n=1 Tax=Halomonas kashgarensis TaxID=3084920 RepID=UPI003217091B